MQFLMVCVRAGLSVTEISLQPPCVPAAGLSQPAPAPPGNSEQLSKLSLKCGPTLNLESPPADRAAAFSGAPAPRKVPVTAAGVEGTPGGEWELWGERGMRPLLVSKMRSLGHTFIRGSAPLTAACLSPALGLYHLPLGFYMD